jgi:hypothetical protein
LVESHIALRTNLRGFQLVQLNTDGPWINTTASASDSPEDIGDVEVEYQRMVRRMAMPRVERRMDP